MNEKDGKVEMENFALLRNELIYTVKGVGLDNYQGKLMRLDSFRRLSSSNYLTALFLRMEYLIAMSRYPNFKEIITRRHGRFSCRNRITSEERDWLCAHYSPDEESNVSFWLLSYATNHSPAGIMRALSPPHQDVVAFEQFEKERLASEAREAAFHAEIEAIRAQHNQYMERELSS